MTDKFAEEAALILHHLALEHRRTWFGFRRWYVADEPLRHDAARLLRRYGWKFMTPIDARYVGDGDG